MKIFAILAVVAALCVCTVGCDPKAKTGGTDGSAASAGTAE